MTEEEKKVEVKVEEEVKKEEVAEEKKKTEAAAAATEEAEEDETTTATAAGDQSEAKKKKKKKKKKKAPTAQTVPPTVPVSRLFGSNPYPQGELLDYEQPNNLWRRESAEAKERESLYIDTYNQFRQAAEVHRQVRQWARTFIKPGMKMIDIADSIETALRKVSGFDPAHPLERGIAFPTGLSLNHCAAHYTPNAGDTLVLSDQDVLKVDIGVHVGGRIIDSAFTLCFDHKFDPLLEAVREATNAGVKAVGADVRLYDVGAAIQEVMESHEIVLKGRHHQIKSVRNLSGHSLGLYQIHAGKSVPIVATTFDGESTKIEEGDFLAIETFGSTGKGVVLDDSPVSHYMMAPNVHPQSVRGGAKAKELLKFISKNYGTMAFARRWLDQAGIEKYQLALKSLVDCGAVNPYPPLCDSRGSYVAQFEHTVAIKPTGKEVFSRGDDY